MARPGRFNHYTLGKERVRPATVKRCLKVLLVPRNEV